MDPERERIERAVAGYEELRAAAAGVSGTDLDAVLRLGAALVDHGRVEERHLYAANRYLDPAVRDELVAEHRELERDLVLLRRLLDSDPRSDDLIPLGRALLRRLRHHIERDERVLYRPLQRPDLRL